MQSVGDVATLLTLRYQRAVPDWKIRRVCDRLFHDLPRVGAARVIAEELVPQIENQLVAEGWLPAMAEIAQ